MTVQLSLCRTRLETLKTLKLNFPYFSIAEESRGELSRFAKNFLPIFFNLYTADPVKDKDPVKLAVFETVKCYFQIADKPVGLQKNGCVL